MENKSIAPNLSKRQRIEELWRRGVLLWKLDATQKELYDLYYNEDHKVMTWLLARRSGKSYTLCVLALEQCLRHPKSIVKFVSPTKLQVNTNVRPLFDKILEDCPQELKPEMKTQDYIYYFPNGSEIQLAGTDNKHAEKLRGGSSDIWFIDEAQDCNDLRYIVNSILLPTTLTTKGKGILSGTPPKETEHDFMHFIEKGQLNGSLIKKTIYDNKRLDPKDIRELIEEIGGLDSADARRELLCEIIKDPRTSALPEFTEELKTLIVKDWPRPPFFDSYVSMDWGGKDFTAVLFGYFDFRANKIIIEDEILMDFQQKDNNIEKLTRLIQEKEASLFTNVLTGEFKEPYIRVSDINYIGINEICKHSGYKVRFQTAKKDDKTTAVNDLRTLLNNQKIIIHPRCVHTIRHMENVRWDKSAQVRFARSAENGHFDLVDCLIYMVRAIIFSKNPYPAHYNLNMKDIYIQNPENFAKTGMDIGQVYKKIFGLKKGPGIKKRIY